MKSKTLSILFVIQKTKKNKQGKCPMRCRLTYNKKRKVFSIGFFIIPEEWNNTLQQVKAHNEGSLVNDNLHHIKQKLSEAYFKLKVNSKDFTVEDIYNEYIGKTTSNEISLIQVYKIHLKRIEKLVGKDIQLVTYKKYEETSKHIKSFVKWKYSISEFKIKELKANFITEFEYYLKIEKGFQQSTINKTIQRFRSVVKYAIAEDYLNKDPFTLYKPKHIKKEVVFLTKQELSLLEAKSFEIDRLQKVCDMFVFCCYTGLGFKEMVALKRENVYNEFDGKLWIHIYRNKTGRTYKIPLLTKAEFIMKKHKNENSEFILPKMYNQPFNAYLKEIANLCNIKKHLTHHIARKTFATTVLLYNDVPMEIVSKLLGHSKIQTTQDHYGHILDENVSTQMKRIDEKIRE
ncbi:tyrosine-type recombinase/integrase [Winogradskyella sediminis]|uniref:tyrosine-type recombinase/integrase n=1 Tax=Winogradskyella sediminis TaxID=1382466 RepID=UPI003AA92A63